MQVLASWAAMSRMELARMPFILDETATALASGDELAHPASTGGVGLGLVSREKEWAEWPVETENLPEFGRRTCRQGNAACWGASTQAINLTAGVRMFCLDLPASSANVNQSLKLSIVHAAKCAEQEWKKATSH